jgi:gamma-glutamyltranspeptidase/glutathione hydrolase
VSASPPASGGVALIDALNILDGFDLAKLDKVTRTHLIVEAMRRAHRDRAVYLGDPDFVRVPVGAADHPYYAAGTTRFRSAWTGPRPATCCPGVDRTAPGSLDHAFLGASMRTGNMVAGDHHAELLLRLRAS